jgi:hypothetical protein
MLVVRVELGLLIGLDAVEVGEQIGRAVALASAIRGAAELLQEADVPEPMRARFLANIDGESLRLQRLVGELDANARLARVLVSVEDPLALRAEAGTPSLILGAFVRTAIEGRALDDVVRLDRDLLRREDTVWVMEDGALDIRDVTVLLRDNDYVYLSDGLDQGDQVVATDLATVVDGAALRLEDAAGAETME